MTFRQITDQVLMNSHADDKQAVLDAVGLTMRDLFDDTSGTRYTYRDGRTVHRTYDDKGRKKFRQAGNTTGRDLYRVERLDQLATGTPVYVVEGEKDVHAVESVGGVAVCSAMGAGKAHLFDWTPLTGHTVVIVADDDEPGRRHAMQVHEIVEPLAAGVAVAQAASGKDAADHIAAGHGLDELEIVALDGNASRRLKVTRGSDVKMQRVKWVMEHWIPAGSLTLLAGREGLGKSTIAAQICAQVTRGQLEGELHGTPRNVLYVHSEDSREFTVAPRLNAAGADMNRVLFVDVETSHTDSGTLILPLDTLALEKVIAQHQVAFVVLDAATSSMSSELSGKDDRAVRQYLEPLAQLAARQGCVVFGLCTSGKGTGPTPGSSSSGRSPGLRWPVRCCPSPRTKRPATSSSPTPRATSPHVPDRWRLKSSRPRSQPRTEKPKSARCTGWGRPTATPESYSPNRTAPTARTVTKPRYGSRTTSPNTAGPPART